jgi:hypothetical protein
LAQSQHVCLFDAKIHGFVAFDAKRLPHPKFGLRIRSHILHQHCDTQDWGSVVFRQLTQDVIELVLIFIESLSYLLAKVYAARKREVIDGNNGKSVVTDAC